MREVNLHISRNSDTVALSVDNTSEANLRIDTHSGLPCLVILGDGNVQMLASGATLTHVYTTNFTGDVLVIPFGGYLDVSRFQSTGSTAWSFDLGVFVPLSGLTTFILNNLPNANIDGGLNSFSGANGLIYFQLTSLPNANIDGTLNSFTGANGLTTFYLNNLPNAIITGSLNSFSGANGLTTFRLQNLPNANIDGSLNSFTGVNGLSLFYLINLPNANINGSLNSFTGANGMTSFYLNNLPNAIITGDSSAFSNKTNLGDFLIFTSPSSNIVINYDDILNIWQSNVNIDNRYSGISASKATTSPFNFNSLRVANNYFRSIGLSTQSMDNMIISLDNSLVAQTDPKIIYLDQNAPHSGSPAVMTALSNLATKNITVVL